MSRLFEYLRENQANMFSDVESLVQSESPSTDKRLVDECGMVLRQLCEDYLSASGEVIRQEQVGDHIKFTFGRGSKKILIIGHFDTVWDKGRLPLRVEGNTAYGPGIFDMKAGLVQALWALRAIKEVHGDFDGQVVCLFNSDEEIGSVTSRPYIEREARECDAAFILEPSVAGSGNLKTGRKGVGMFKVQIRGVSAHAGNHHEDGVSAVEELGHVILALQGATDYSKGTTVNVGIVRGGTRTNVVADEAAAEVDFRVKTKAEADRLQKYVKSLTPTVKGASIEVSGGLNRPPMERTPGTVRLFERARQIAAGLRFSVGESEVGGGSDGNFVSAIGIPTLDGLGPVGGGAHAVDEHIQIDKLPERAALLAHLILDSCSDDGSNTEPNK